MKKLFRTASISLYLLSVCGITIACANAQSLTSVPQPSSEIVGLTKALEGECSLNVKFEPNSAAPREGFRLGFQHDALWKVSLIDEAVDVAGGGDLAVYRGTYNEDNGHDGVLMTHRTNFIAEFKRQSDGSWRIVWYSVSNMERSHPK
jgi:hypothetical protein